MVRLKNRYLLLDVSWKDGRIDEGVAEQQLLQALRDSVAQNFGDFGLGSNLASLQVKYFSAYTGVGIVRCAAAQQDRVVTALTFLTDIKQRAATARVVRLSGTLATAKAAARELSETRLAARRVAVAAHPGLGPAGPGPAGPASGSDNATSSVGAGFSSVKLSKQQLATAEQLHRLISGLEL